MDDDIGTQEANYVADREWEKQTGSCADCGEPLDDCICDTEDAYHG